jgi:hypothetical protein
MENNTHFTKTCSKCKIEKSNLEFCKCKTGTLGLFAFCKKCVSEINKNKQLEKQKNNKCVICNIALIGRILSSKYCKECKKEIKKEWKRESYKRNIDTVIKYNLENKESIRKKDNIREFERRKNLTDRYVKKLLYEKNGFTVEQLKNNPELIELKRLILKIKRL